MKKLTILLICFGYSYVMNAQQLGLQEAINIALKNNFDIQIAKNNVAINKINNHIGFAGGLPFVTATLSDQESIVNINQELNTGTKINRNGAVSNILNANVTSSILLFNGHRVVATKKRLEELQKQSEQQLNAQIQTIIASVMLRYYDVIRQQGYVKTLQQAIELTKKQLQLVQIRQNIGMANDADIFQSKIALNTRELDLQNQQLIIQQTKADLFNVLNLKADTLLKIEDSILVAQNLTLNDVLIGIDKNPAIISLSNQITINELTEKETASQRIPSLRGNLGLNYGRNQANGGQLLLNQSYGPFVSVGLSVPIYNGTVLKRQQQTAAILTQNAKLQKESTLASFKTNAVKNYQAYTNSLQQAATQQNTYAISAQLVNLVLQRYQLAQATIVELQEALRSYEEAGYRLTNLLYNAKIAEIELKRLAGILGL